jgi:uncharacterized membrane protein
MQNYSNHTRFNPFHHFVIIPLAVFLIAWTFLKVLSSEISLNEKVFYIISSILILFITLITRLYALKNQDRLIRVEMRLRYFELTGKSFSMLEEQLQLSQLIALRFASDEELLALIDKTLKENLSNKEIKKAIKNWKADLMRV